MHQQDRTEMWMRRPLPPALLEYAAHDIELIAKLFTRFQKKGKYLDDVETLKEMSTRYMEVFATRELRAKHASLKLCKFVPMEVLTPPQYDAPRFECARCARVLSLQCFSTAESIKPVEGGSVAASEPKAQVAEPTGGNTAMYRQSFCRLCHLVARRNSEAASSNLVAIEDC